jgi:hypothetical protein
MNAAHELPSDICLPEKNGFVAILIELAMPPVFTVEADRIGARSPSVI